ncbi:MAG: hypothetical protein C0606_00675 [Hyphomicrobiales bacterium]|nr:MAG: hypothetical protein C0606_00675 [Hyphomicrobiales bacterium]
MTGTSKTEKPARFRLSRRAFLASAGAATVAVAVGGGYALTQVPSPLSGREINAFVSLLEDGQLQIVCPAQDLGQGAPLALAMIVAEEAGADLSRIDIIAAPRDASTYGNPIFDGHLVTADSKTTRGYYQPLRLAGAEARRAFIETACRAHGWGPADCVARGHAVIHEPSGARADFAEIAAGGSLVMPGAASEADLKNPEAFDLLGKSPAPSDLIDKVTGAKRYGVDRREADTLVAVLVRSPHLGGTVATLDDAAARAVAGVEEIVRLDDAVAVVARDTWSALKGRDALSIKWSAPGDFSTVSDEARLADALADETRAWVPLRDSGIASGAATLEARFTAPALKHVIMEPLNATARPTHAGLGVAISGSTQSLDLDMRYAAKTWKTAPFTVETVGAPCGGAFGRRVLNDAVRDAALVAKAVGRPVQIIRPMLDELQRGQIRPPAAQSIRAHLDDNGMLAGWDHAIASDGTLATHLPGSLKGPNGDEDNTATDGAYHPYRVAHDRIRWTRVESLPAPGFLRSVSAGYTVWAVETTVERLARKAGQDPLSWRRAHIDEPRLVAVMERAAANARWGEPGRALGLGVMSFRGSAIATVAEVRENRISGLWIAADVGRVVHRDAVLAQIEGAVWWGMSMALTERLSYADGRAEVESLADYPMFDVSEMPSLDIALMDDSGADEPFGVGEIGIPTLIPAVCNAFEAATGKTYDRLPLA